MDEVLECEEQMGVVLAVAKVKKKLVVQQRKGEDSLSGSRIPSSRPMEGVGRWAGNSREAWGESCRTLKREAMRRTQ